MIGHDESGSFDKSPNDLPTFNAENMLNNMKAIYYSRTFMSIVGGVIAGILGFTSLTGFIFYFLVMAITLDSLQRLGLRSIRTLIRGTRLYLTAFWVGLWYTSLPFVSYL